MTCIRWLLPLLAVCFGLTEARAQGVFLPNPYGAGYYSTGGSLTYVRVRRSRGLAIALGGFRVRGYSVVGPLGAFPVTFAPVSTVTVVVVRRPIYLDDLPIEPPPREGRIEAGDPPDVPGPDEVVRVPKPPLPPLPKKEPPKKEEIKPPPKEVPPKIAPKALRKIELPRPPEPDEDTRSEYERLVDGGREAFQAFEYGRAAMRFRRATEIEPAQPLAHFLLAQALLAQGKYHEASDAIHAGMARAPNWPTSPFQPLQLYGPNVADYSAHLALLDATLKRHPDDPVLLFLSAYHLWFDGRKEEAGPLFRRALPGAADPGVIDRFLRALPAAPEL